MSGEWAVLWTIAGWIDGGGELRVNHSRIARVLKEKAIWHRLAFLFCQTGKKNPKDVLGTWNLRDVCGGKVVL